MTERGRRSPYSPTTTLDRFERAVRARGGITVFERVEHSRIANRPHPHVELLQIENPQLVATLLDVDPAIAFDLPIKILAWSRDEGGSYVRVTDPADIAFGRDDPEIIAVRATISQLLGSWLDVAVGLTSPD